jgi:hypothetical protein
MMALGVVHKRRTASRETPPQMRTSPVPAMITMSATFGDFE